MTTIRTAKKAKKRDPATNMWASPGFVKTLLAVASAFGSWSLLLPVVPLAVLNEGGSQALAGGTTAAFMLFTVVTQWFTPAAVRRWGYIKVMMFAAFILGVPSVFYAVSMAAIPVLLVSGVRGIGFGALCVAQAALIAEVVEPKFLGKASGTLGFVIGLTQMIVLPIGLFLAENMSFNLVYILGTIIAVAATFACYSLPRVAPAPKEGANDSVSGGLPPVATWKLITVPAIAVGTFSMGYGAVSSFLPAAVKDMDTPSGPVVAGLVLGVAAGAQMVTRYWAGIIADRKGQAGATTIPSMVCGALGLILAGVILSTGVSPWLMLVSALLFGGGFGAAQNEALLMMFARLPKSRVTDASAFWNMAYDSGTGIGAIALGAIAGTLLYPGMFHVAGLVLAGGVIIVWLDRLIGRHRIAERNNTRARLRKVPVARKAYHATRKMGQATMKPVHAASALAKKAPKAHLSAIKPPRIGVPRRAGKSATTITRIAVPGLLHTPSSPPADSSPQVQQSDTTEQ